MMTVHAAKGLEFLCFCHRLEQDLFLTREWVRDLNQKKTGESVAFFTCVTRKEKLYLSYASVRTIFGQRQVTPSEFLSDIDDAYTERETGTVTTNP